MKLSLKPGMVLLAIGQQATTQVESIKAVPIESVRAFQERPSKGGGARVVTSLQPVGRKAIRSFPRHNTFVLIGDDVRKDQMAKLSRRFPPEHILAKADIRI